WPIWMVARSSTLSSVYDIGAAPYRKGQVLHSVFAAALYNHFIIDYKAHSREPGATYKADQLLYVWVT
ncbi:hypothetical protein ACRCPS_34230, partial [Pseudomonas aeruginosa]